MKKNRENHPIHNIDVARIMVKATRFAFALVGIILLILYLNFKCFSQ